MAVNITVGFDLESISFPFSAWTIVLSVLWSLSFEGNSDEGVGIDKNTIGRVDITFLS